MRPGQIFAKKQRNRPRARSNEDIKCKHLVVYLYIPGPKESGKGTVKAGSENWAGNELRAEFGVGERGACGPGADVKLR